MSFKVNFTEQEIGWEQSFSNYRKALVKLNVAISVLAKITYENEHTETIIEILKDGLIHRFEYTHELACKVMKDYAEYLGNTAITGSRDATREAFKMGLTQEADSWMDIFASRNLTSHTYDSGTAEEIYDKIIHTYITRFNDFEQKMESLRSDTQFNLFDKA